MIPQIKKRSKRKRKMKSNKNCKNDKEDNCNYNISYDKGDSAPDNKIKKEKKENIKFDLDSKDNIMKMINSQDYIEGCWEENEYTKLVKEKLA